MTKASLLIVMLAMMMGCDRRTTAPTPISVSIPTQPTEARVTVDIGDANITVWSIRPPQARMAFPVTISESAGVAVRVNFVRLDLRWLGRRDHRSEVGANQIITDNGTNLVVGNGRFKISPIFIVPLHSDLSGLRITVGMTDVNGNDKTWTSSSGSLTTRLYNSLAKTLK